MPDAIQSLKNKIREEDLTDWLDYPRVRQSIFDTVTKAVGQAFPVENAQYRLELEDLKLEGKDRIPRHEHKKALLTNGTLSRPLTGRYVVKKKDTGEVVAKSNRKILMNVPYMTDDGTFVRNGVAYSVARQLRLRPGVYARITSDGYPEAQFNTKQGTGPGFRVFMEPDTSLFYMRLGTRRIMLLPVLRAMGVPDDRVRQAWGDDVFKVNAEQKVPAHTQNWLKSITEQMRARQAPQSEEVPAENTAFADALQEQAPETINDQG